MGLVWLGVFVGIFWLGFLAEGLRGEFEQDRFGWNDLNEKIQMESKNGEILYLKYFTKNLAYILLEELFAIFLEKSLYKYYTVEVFFQKINGQICPYYFNHIL